MVKPIAILNAVKCGLRHLFYNRMTRRYPEVKSGLPEEYYSFDAKKGVGVAGWRGRHYLELDKCTGCQQCAFMCDEISNAIVMVELPELKFEQNKKSLFPSIDYGRCVFCGLCVDACPFGSLHMTPEVRLADYDRNRLYYSPLELSIPPPVGKPSYLVGKKKEAARFERPP